ncbi:hypothetical protein [Streptomyces sp. RerS4]|uniref:hypothetical protein n=1 Tax=Streptomyces sp. RerS4 TaxID=2942449 RepID=UPI00201C1546|nr:hypothetical protein [Streptomyces sp. RerS4]UQX04686.1 hypothetical protein M4D82_32370 [Streptomyces sp. RerS4]
MSFPRKRAAAAVATAVLGVVLAATSGQAYPTAPAADRATATATATAPDPAANARVERLWAAAGDEQKAKAGTTVPTALKVRAIDKDLKPVPGATITFSTPGPGLKFPNGDDDATATTDNNGYATAPALKAAGAPGPDLVIAKANDRAQTGFEITIT